MVAEVMRALAVRPEGNYLDATFGGGGHSQHLLAALGPTGHLLAMDRDPAAISSAQASLSDPHSDSDPRPQLRLVCDNFSHMARHIADNSLDGVLMDLGLSSNQLDDDTRGFSFHATGPLDMRMDPRTGQTAAEWLEQAETEQMERVFREYGGERHAAAIAHEIDRVRSVAGVPESADELSALVCRVKPARDGRRHPATRVFQALRMVVNGELEELAQGLSSAAALLCTGGRLAVIAFHSLEDSQVAQWFRQCPQLAPVGRVMRPTSDEKRRNPRSRSALLRVAEKTP